MRKPRFPKKPLLRKVKKPVPHEGIVCHAKEFGLGAMGIAEIWGTLEAGNG